MGLLVSHNGLLLKINLEKNQIDYSKNEGKTWHMQGKISSSYGDFQDLTSNGDKLIAVTTKGVFQSKNDGKTWHKS